MGCQPRLRDHTSRITPPGSALAQLARLTLPLGGRMILAVLLGSATVASSVGLMATSAYLIAAAALHPPLAVLALPMVGVRFWGIARGVFRYAERLWSHDVTFRLLARLRVWAYRQMEPRAPTLLLQYRSGDLLSRVVSDIETLQHFFIRALAPSAVALLIAILAGLFLYYYAPVLVAPVLALMFLAGILLPLLVQRLSREAGRRIVETRSALQAGWIDGLQGQAELLALGQEQHHAKHLEALSDQLFREQGRMVALTGMYTALGNLLAHLALGTTLLVVIPGVAAGRLNGIDLPVLALATLASFEAALALPAAFQHLETSRPAAARLFELSRQPLTSPSPSQGRNLDGYASPLPALPSQGGKLEGSSDSSPCEEGAGGGVEQEAHSSLAQKQLRQSGLFPLVVTDLRFRYASAEPPVLNGVSFELRPGQHVVLVGSSGAGKSTLASLLVRFWDYQEGHITLGGQDLRAFDPGELRRWISVVPQQPYLFNATIRENLLLARPQASPEELIAAAEQAQLQEFISSLPYGYDTRVGEQGLRLSAGERQRLALARALLQDAPILLLDEPTAHLDALTERQILETIRTVAARRALLLMTHRLVGLESFDEVLVLRSGRIVERGRHSDLLQRPGWYRRMWELQQGNLDLESLAVAAGNQGEASKIPVPFSRP